MCVESVFEEFITTITHIDLTSNTILKSKELDTPYGFPGMATAAVADSTVASIYCAFFNHTNGSHSQSYFIHSVVTSLPHYFFFLFTRWHGNCHISLVDDDP